MIDLSKKTSKHSMNEIASEDGSQADEQMFHSGEFKVVIPDFEVILDEAGGYGSYQLMLNAIITLATNCSGYIIYGQAYQLLYPDFLCSIDGRELPHDSQEYQDKCIPEVFCQES